MLLSFLVEQSTTCFSSRATDTELNISYLYIYIYVYLSFYSSFQLLISAVPPEQVVYIVFRSVEIISERLILLKNKQTPKKKLKKIEILPSCKS